MSHDSKFCVLCLSGGHVVETDTKLPHGLTSTTLAILLDRALNGDPTAHDAKVIADVYVAMLSHSIGDSGRLREENADLSRQLESLRRQMAAAEAGEAR